MDNLVHFLDANYKKITQPIDTYTSLSYESKWDEYGNFKFVDKPSLFVSIKDAKRMSVNGNMFLVENIKTKDATANNELSVFGRSLEALLDKVINPTPLRIRGNLEVQIRAVVTSLAITGLQAVTKLTLGTLHGYLNSIDTVVPRGSLGLWLYTILNQRGFTYTLTYVQSTDTVVFDIVQEVDRSTTAIFSAQVGNIENVEYSSSDTDACNFAIVYDDETGEVVYVDESNGEEKRGLLVQGKSANTASDDNTFVMIGSNGRGVYTSTNGKDFTLKYTFPADIVINDVTYSAGLFIACGYNSTSGVGLIAESTGGAVTWTTTVTTSAGRIFERVSYYDGLTVCVIGTTVSGGADPTVARIATSYDNVNFEITSALGVTSFSKPRYINGYWFIGAETAAENSAIIYRSKYGFDWEKITFAVDTDPATILPNVAIRDFISQYGTIKAIGYVDPVGDNGDLLVVTSDDLFETATIETFDTTVDPTETGNAAWVGNAIAVGIDKGLIYSSDNGDTFSSISGFDTTLTYRFVDSDGATIHAYGAILGGTVTHFYTTDAVTWTTETIATVSAGSRVGAFGSSTQRMSMVDIGRAALAENRAVEVINGDVLPDTAPIIGTDCNIGDVTSIVDIKRGIIASKRLISAQTVIEPKAHYTVPKFGEDYLSLTKYIKKEIAKNV